MMTPREYMDWWIALPENYEGLDEPIRTLVQHIETLQERIGELSDGLNCCCAFDHPNDVCMPHHAKKQASERGVEQVRS